MGSNCDISYNDSCNCFMNLLQLVTRMSNATKDSMFSPPTSLDSACCRWSTSSSLCSVILSCCWTNFLRWSWVKASCRIAESLSSYNVVHSIFSNVFFSFFKMDLFSFWISLLAVSCSKTTGSDNNWWNRSQRLRGGGLN